MATRTTQVVTTAGLAPTYHAATATTGDKVLPSDDTIVHIKNASGVSTAAVFATPGTVDTLAIADRTVTVAAGTDQFVKVTDIYRDPADGLATFVCTPSASVTFAVIRP